MRRRIASAAFFGGISAHEESRRDVMRHSSVKSFQVAANFANMQIIRLLLFYRHFHAEINKFCRLFPWLISALNIKIPFAFLYGFHWAHCINHFTGKDKFFKSCFSASLKHFQVVY